MIKEVSSYTPAKGSKRPQIKRKTLSKGKGLSKKKTALRGKNKPKGVSKLMKELDAVFSRYVRLKNADSEGIVSCYTCGHRNHYKKMQNGHYISRFYKKYRFDERNCRVQCSMCNMWKSGDIPTFRIRLVQELGLAEVESMEADYKELYKLDIGFLEERIIHYQQAVHNPIQGDSDMVESK